MCGIFGIWRFDGRPVELALLRSATNTLRHRGPDDEGYLLAATATDHIAPYGGADTDPRLDLPVLPTTEVSNWDLAFGFRRLAILDLSPAGHQPMPSADGRLWLIFNGEIYNYLELRDELAPAGYRFRSGGDAEVILAAYQHWGPDCLAHFNGMWAFAVYDRAERSLFLARDRFGVKPLYYVHDRSQFAFASEIKALVGPHGLSFQPDDAVVYDYLVGGRMPDPQAGQTFFVGVQALPPGHWLRVRHGGDLVHRRYWSLPDPTDVRDEKPERAISRYRELFLDAVRLRLRSDVPVGTCLSGGVDSSSIVCAINWLMAAQGFTSEQIGQHQRTFSAIYDTPAPYNELPYIERVLRATSAEGNLTTPTLARLRLEAERLVWHQDEPFQSTSIFAQWCVMAKARERGVTVLLDGQGADETLAGYRPFMPVIEELIRAARLRRALAEARAIEARTGQSARALLLRGLLRQVHGPGLDVLRDMVRRRRMPAPADLAYLNRDFAAAQRKRTPLDWQPWLEHHTLSEHLTSLITRLSLPRLLQYEDRNSMAFGIEARVPFLDYRLVTYTFEGAAPWRVYDGWTKWILRQAMKDLVPPEIIWRKDKVGFETPETQWLAAWVQSDLDLFADGSPAERYLDLRAVRQYLAANSAKGADHRLIWRWINLILWLRVWCGASG